MATEIRYVDRDELVALRREQSEFAALREQIFRLRKEIADLEREMRDRALAIETTS